MSNYQSMKCTMLDNNYTSYFVREALTALEQRDPVDALDDAEMLVKLCNQRLKDIQAECYASLGVGVGQTTSTVR